MSRDVMISIMTSIFPSCELPANDRLNCSLGKSGSGREAVVHMYVRVWVAPEKVKCFHGNLYSSTQTRIRLRLTSR